MEYWNECIREAFEDEGIEATDKQIDNVAGWVEGAHENYGMAFGYDCIPNPLIAEIDTIKKHMKELENAYERQIDGIRSGVAQRRGVDISAVHIEEDGRVTYDRR